MRRTSDEQLADQARRGDRRAMEALVDRHYGSLVNFASRFLGRSDLAPDVVQDTFVKVTRRMDSFRRGASFRTWLFAVCANACRDELRRIKRRREVLEADGPELQVVSDFTADEDESTAPVRVLDRRLKAMEVRQAVNALPEAHREAVVLRYFHDLSLKEIAEVCECSVGTVGSRLHYAVKKLSKELAPEAAPNGGTDDGVFEGQAAAAGSRRR